MVRSGKASAARTAASRGAHEWARPEGDADREEPEDDGRYEHEEPGEPPPAHEVEERGALLLAVGALRAVFVLPPFHGAAS